MRIFISSALILGLASVAVAQRPLVGGALEVTNQVGVISTTIGTSGFNYPAGGTYPPSFGLPTGVKPGARAWTYTPEQRFQGGHVPGKFLTITGMTQSINLGGDVTLFPSPSHYQFATGIGPAAPDGHANGKAHAPTGADIVYFPAGTITPTGGGILRHSFTLATPVSVPPTDLLFFVEYKGGEYYFSTTNGQTVGSDWRGGQGELRGLYAGFTEGSNPRTIQYVGNGGIYRPQIGAIVEEPIFTATGFHANQYYTPPLQNEDYVGLNAAWADWRATGNVNLSLFFHFSVGQKFGNGTATVFANFSRASFPGVIPTPFGNLLLNPVDPTFTVFADAGLVFNLDPSGHYVGGPTAPLYLNALPAGAAGLILKTQGIVFDPVTKALVLTNASSIKVR